MAVKNPCENCQNKQVDEYGYLCDLACGGHTAYINYQAGIKEVLSLLERKDHYGEYEEDVYLIPKNWDFKLKEWGL